MGDQIRAKIQLEKVATMEQKTPTQKLRIMGMEGQSWTKSSIRTGILNRTGQTQHFVKNSSNGNIM